nr:hypothetical protein [uncultured Sulfitobacter sp.]
MDFSPDASQASLPLHQRVKKLLLWETFGFPGWQIGPIRPDHHFDATAADISEALEVLNARERTNQRLHLGNFDRRHTRCLSDVILRHASHITQRAQLHRDGTFKAVPFSALYDVRACNIHALSE